jgi:hypothetical protein
MPNLFPASCIANKFCIYLSSRSFEFYSDFEKQISISTKLHVVDNPVI